MRMTDIAGVQIGHAQDLEAATGCTVVLCPEGATVGVDVRGGAPSTRETDLLDPVNLVQKAHAVLLTGGSAFGLDAAAGVMRYLEEQGVGFDVQVTRVPIVCGAALFDLTLGDHRVRPDSAMGYAACLAAAEAVQSGAAPALGSVGAGTGATVGKILGMEQAMKGGVGMHAEQHGDLQVAALVAVNCLGDVIDPEAGQRLAGPLQPDRRSLGDTESIMTARYSERKNLFSGNTTIGVVVTNAALSKAEATKVASMAHNGYARSIRPAHSMFDGDTIFVMGAGTQAADLTVIGLLAARAVERAVVSAVIHAESLCGVPGHREVFGPGGVGQRPQA